jgi:DNA-binding transcriptional ArsR family regulator
MSVSDDEPYQTIFASLKHPIRRRILRMLSKNPMTFSEMLDVLGVSNSFLTYHLENLGELVSKVDDGKYRLSSFGEAAMATLTKVEDIPTTAPQQSPQTKPKRVVTRNVAMALGIMCIVLVAGIGGAIIQYTLLVNDKDKTISSQNSQLSILRNQNTQLETWLDGNETLLNQTQADNINLQKQIDSLNSNVTSLQNQVNNFHIGSTTNSTILFDSEIVTTIKNGSISPDENVSLGIENVGMAVMTPTAGYLSIRVSSNNNSTYVVFGNIYISNSTSFNVTVFGPINQYLVGLGGTIVFPVSAASTTEIYFESSIGEATLTVTITYYY